MFPWVEILNVASFVTLGIFEKLICTYRAWQSPERHASNSALSGGLV